MEIAFSIIQKKVLTPGDFPGLGTLSYALLAFVHRYNRTARPFNGKFSAHDPTALLQHISQNTGRSITARRLRLSCSFSSTATTPS